MDQLLVLINFKLDQPRVDPENSVDMFDRACGGLDPLSPLWVRPC